VRNSTGNLPDENCSSFIYFQLVSLLLQTAVLISTECSWSSFFQVFILGNHGKITMTSGPANAGPEILPFFSLFELQNLDVTVIGN
jgi:hypothetical protein